MKITKTKERINRKDITKFFVDGILIAICYQYKEFYCTVDKQGRPSNIRDRVKTAKETHWIKEGLKQLLGDDVYGSHSTTTRKKLIFNDDYPDLTWGYPGSLLTPKKIKQAIESYKVIQTQN